MLSSGWGLPPHIIHDSVVCFKGTVFYLLSTIASAGEFLAKRGDRPVSQVRKFIFEKRVKITSTVPRAVTCRLSSTRLTTALSCFDLVRAISKYAGLVEIGIKTSKDARGRSTGTRTTTS